MAFCSRDVLGHEGGYCLSVLAKIGAHGHDASDDRAHGGVSFVLEGVLESDVMNQRLRLLVGLPIHVARLPLFLVLQEMLDESV